MASISKKARDTASASAGEVASAVREASAVAASATASTMDFNVEMARNLVSSSLGASQGLLKFWNQVLQINAQTLKEMTTSLNEAVTQAQQARDLPELLNLQAELASGQWSHATQNCGAVMARWMDAEAHLVEQAQDEAAQVSRRVLATGNAMAPQHQATPPADATPLALLGSAQSAMTEMTRQWVEMVKSAAGRGAQTQH
jgi:hypothetical protein